MAESETNIRFIRRSRKSLAPGDIFVMQLPTQEFLFGRVILVEPPFPMAPTIKANLVYVYAERARSKEPDLSKLHPDNLLIPPSWTNRLGWFRGFFETIAHVPLEPGDLLKQHCFIDHVTKTYVDQRGDRLSDRCEPCGQWALGNYRTIDDDVSDALGIARAPELDGK